MRFLVAFCNRQGYNQVKIKKGVRTTNMAAELKPVTTALATIDDPDFPHNLSVGDAKLPVVYESAKLALSECSRIDECKDWADKAEALASYARQAGDDALRNMAVKIQARAIRKCGELLQEIEESKGGRPPKMTVINATAIVPVSRTSDGRRILNEKPIPPPIQVSRSQAARDAGMSKRQKDTALRVASVPTQQFEAAIESPTPPTVTKLAEIGTKPRPQPLIDLKGRAPEDFKACTQALGHCQRFDDFAAETQPAAIARGASDFAKAELRERAPRIIAWVQQLQKELA